MRLVSRATCHSCAPLSRSCNTFVGAGLASLSDVRGNVTDYSAERSS